MKDPRRLLEGDGTDFERELLGAVADERPSADLQRRMRIGIGLVGAGMGTSAAAKAAPAGWGQAVVAGVVAAGIAVGGAFIAMRDSAEPARAPAPVVAAAKVEAPAPEQDLEPVPVPAPEVVDAPAPEAPRAVEPQRRNLSTPPVIDVKEEIRLLDQARSAVRSGASSEALAVLRKYDQRFPRGQFRQEVTVLRMEALYQSGDRARASAMAKKFLRNHPNSPHVARVERVSED